MQISASMASQDEAARRGQQFATSADSLTKWLEDYLNKKNQPKTTSPYQLTQPSIDYQPYNPGYSLGGGGTKLTL